MNQVELARFIGTLALIITFLLKGLILFRYELWIKYGRAVGIWLIMYIYFLIVLRIFALLKLATPDELVLISGYTALIPLFGILLHIFVRGKETK